MQLVKALSWVLASVSGAEVGQRGAGSERVSYVDELCRVRGGFSMCDRIQKGGREHWPSCVGIRVQTSRGGAGLRERAGSDRKL